MLKTKVNSSGFVGFVGLRRASLLAAMAVVAMAGQAMEGPDVY